MTPEITIHYLAFTRPNYYDVILNQVKQIREDLKPYVQFWIYGSESEHLHKDWPGMVADLKAHGMEAKVPTHINSYDVRINAAFNCGTKYSIKLDEDIFVNHHILDFMIEHRNVLDDDKNLFVAPYLSTGILTVDRFIEGFVLDSNVKNELYNTFKSTRMPSHLWGVNYDSLNDATTRAGSWNSKKYYELVSQIKHPYKGIRPIRINEHAQRILNDYTVKNRERLLHKENYILKQTFEFPYFCNSFFLVKNSDWKESFETRKFDDGFDEVPLNQYRDRTGKGMIFIDNAWIVHPSYNSIGDAYRDISDIFFNNIRGV